MGFEEFIVYARGLVYLATFILLASFSGKGSRWRPMVSLFAVVLAGSSAALAVYSFLAPPAVVYIVPTVLQTAYCLSVFGLVLGCRGNLAKIVPPFKGRAHV